MQPGGDGGCACRGRPPQPASPPRSGMGRTPCHHTSPPPSEQASCLTEMPGAPRHPRWQAGPWGAPSSGAAWASARPSAAQEQAQGCGLGWGPSDCSAGMGSSGRGASLAMPRATDSVHPSQHPHPSPHDPLPRPCTSRGPALLCLFLAYPAAPSSAPSACGDVSAASGAVHRRGRPPARSNGTLTCVHARPWSRHGLTVAEQCKFCAEKVGQKPSARPDTGIPAVPSSQLRTVCMAGGFAGAVGMGGGQRGVFDTWRPRIQALPDPAQRAQEAVRSNPIKLQGAGAAGFPPPSPIFPRTVIRCLT